MIKKIIGFIITGIVSSLLFIVFLIAWGAIHGGLQEISKDNPQAQQILNSTDKAVQETTTWYFTIGDLEDLVFFIGIALGIGAGAGYIVSKIGDQLQFHSL